MADQESLIEYPSPFPLKIMGVAEETLVEVVLEIVTRHDPEFDHATMERRASSSGKYISLTCTVTATSRAQLDALYLDLTGHPLIKVVL
ncbi:MAG: YbeD family protein [Betaproteobacteria bacterium]